MKLLYMANAVGVSITSPFLLTLLATQALKATGNKSTSLEVSISGIKSDTSSKLAIAKYLSLSSETKGLIAELKIVVYLWGFMICDLSFTNRTVVIFLMTLTLAGILLTICAAFFAV